MTDCALAAARPNEFRRHWGAVLACFMTAVFAWGFGFYGQSVYLSELHRMRGWSTFLIASATTVFYIAGALGVTRAHALIASFGSRIVLAGGAVLLGLGAVLFCRSTAPWQLFPAALVMASGWACTSAAAISTTLALWFDRRRGLAISLALNGASSAGFIVPPALITLSAHHGLPTATAELVLALLIILIPLVFLGIDSRSLPKERPAAPPDPADARPSYLRSTEALRDRRFWSVALPFGLALAAQVGFIVHSVALLLPRLGPGGAAWAVSLVAITATLGRTGLGLVVDRLDQRSVSAASFASQAVALGIILALPTQPASLYGACCLFGLSVGNIITLPSLIIQREFAARSFGFVLGLSTGFAQVTFACGPALLGLIRDLAGSYEPALVVCMVLELAAAAIIVGCRPDRTGFPLGLWARPLSLALSARRPGHR